jgi:excisionase family DNA binding protein
MSKKYESILEELGTIKQLILNGQVQKENKLYSVKSLSTHAGVSELTVRNWIIEGKIQAKRIGRRLFIDESQFEKGLEEVKSLKYKR